MDEERIMDGVCLCHNVLVFINSSRLKQKCVHSI